MRFGFLITPAVFLAPLILLAGCTTFQHVKPLTEEEQKECAVTKLCEVWTPSQLRSLAERAYLEGMARGRKDGT